MHKCSQVRDEDGALAYECGACGARSTAAADVVLWTCAACGRSAAEVERELGRLLAEFVEVDTGELTRAA